MMKINGKKILTRSIAALLCLCAALSFVSCKGMELENKTEIVEEYTLPQAMILIANERNKYESVYSPEIWKVSIGDENSFDRLTVQNVRQFMERLKLLCMLAEEKGITATSQERDIIRQVTDEYMKGLTEEDAAYIGCTRADVQKLYTDYFVAEKLIKSIIGEVDSEISDSEVKVIRIQQIGTTDLKKAKAILKRIKIDKESFSSMAGRYSETEDIEITLMRDRDNGLIKRTAFSLEEGQVSNILAVGDMYYIIKCVDGYDEEETLERKNKLSRALNTTAAEKVLSPYQREHNIVFIEKYWNEIDFSEESGSTVQNFFDLYKEKIG